MSCARNRRLPLFRALALLGIVGTWAVACGGPQPLGATGSVCFRADECQPGLACVPQTVGATKHVCSADLSGIISMVDGAAPVDMPDAMGGAPQAGGPATAGAAPSAGAAGKPAAGGAPGAAGAATAGAPAGGSASAGAPAGGAPSGGAPAGGASAAGAPAAGAPAGGSSSAGGGAANGGASAGTGG